MTTWEEIRAKREKNPLEHIEWMVFDPDLREEWQQASRRYIIALATSEQLKEQADDTPDSTIERAQTRVDVAKAALQDVQDRCEEAGVMVGWHFGTISPAAFEELKRKHPPKRKGDQWDPAFEPELISTCLTDPTMTVEDVEEFRNSPEFSPAEYTQVLAAALTICQVATSVHLPGKG